MPRVPNNDTSPHLQWRANPYSDELNRSLMKKMTTNASSCGHVSVPTKKTSHADLPLPQNPESPVRGALWLAYGQQAVDDAIASCRSYREHNATKTAIVLDEDVYDIPAGVFDDRIVPSWPVNTHHAKARLDLITPFDTTVLLDTDTRVYADLRFGFESAERHGLACSIAPASQAAIHWGIDCIDRDAPEYNTGVVFWSTHEPKVFDVFVSWRRHADRWPGFDQPSFAVAVAENHFNPFVLPREWNYRAGIDGDKWYGDLKVWHSRIAPPDRVPCGAGFVQLQPNGASA